MPEPVTVAVEVARPRQEVFDLVDVAANHERWMDHLFKDWHFEGPPRGVGAITRAMVNAPAARETIRIEVVESTPPEQLVEEEESAHGKRRTRGTYRFVELAADRTRIEFELAWLEAPRSERLVPFVSRVFMRRANGKGMKRLAALLEAG